MFYSDSPCSHLHPKSEILGKYTQGWSQSSLLEEKDGESPSHHLQLHFKSSSSFLCIVCLGLRREELSGQDSCVAGP